MPPASRNSQKHKEVVRSRQKSPGAGSLETVLEGSWNVLGLSGVVFGESLVVLGDLGLL